MADPTPEELNETSKALQQASDLFGAMFLEGVNNQEAILSKALFPDTHIIDFEIDGKKRKLRPVPIKTSKELWNALKPFSEQYSKAIRDRDTIFQIDMLAVDSLKTACVILCSFYEQKEPGEGWAELKKQVEDDLIAIGELQQFAIFQERLNGTNDFLLSPLRTLITCQRTAELLVAKTQQFFSTQGSQKSGDVPTTT